ncbi:MAG: FAD-binding protein [Oscillospiraceae bacterium]|nr:FAD-binding protein [Oscillospiraceae bacterium]
MEEVIKSDVLVIGAGGAGMMAAVEAAREGARVCLVSKCRVLRGGATIMAPGAIAAVDEAWKSPGDSIELHIEDTLKCGQGLSDPYVVEETVKRAGEMIRQLESMGAMFQRTADGSTLAVRITGGHSFPRSPFIENRVGREICRVLYSEMLRLGVRIIEQVVVTEPIIVNTAVCGARGILMPHSIPVSFHAKSVILATGGAGRIYEITDNPSDLTGDGYAFSLHSGAKLSDMEFVQFFPICFLQPTYARGQVAGFPAYVRLYNSLGERFMENYGEHLELSTRDTLCMAIANEVRAGRGSPSGGVYCSLEHCKRGTLEQETPSLFSIYQSAGIDPYSCRFEVGPSCHFFQGGVRVNHERMSNVKGLYAVGEAACGMHGANRLGQNALTDILVSGVVAGRYAVSATSMETPPSAPQEARGEYRIAEGTNQLRARIRSLMQNHAGVLRDGKGLAYANDELDDIALRIKCGAADGTDIITHNMLETARCVVKSAFLRNESRGCHCRNDYPERDDEHWLKHIYVEYCRNDLKAKIEKRDDNES